MAFFKKESGANGKSKKEKRTSFGSFPKKESGEKKKPFGKGGKYYEKKKTKPLGEGELPASRGFFKSKTGYNNPAAPWNREKKVEEKKSYGEDRPKTFQKKWALRDPIKEPSYENNPENYGPAKLQFRRISKRAQRSFSKNKEAAYLKKKQEGEVLSESEKEYKRVTPVSIPEIHEEKKKFMHGKPPKKMIPKKEERDTQERIPKPKKKPNPKPFKPAMPSNWRKVGE